MKTTTKISILVKSDGRKQEPSSLPLTYWHKFIATATGFVCVLAAYGFYLAMQPVRIKYQCADAAGYYNRLFQINDIKDNHINNQYPTYGDSSEDHSGIIASKQKYSDCITAKGAK